MKVLVTFAVSAEFAPWRARHAFSASAEAAEPGAGDCICYDGYVGKTEVRVVLTGIGGQNAALRTHRTLWDVPDLCISSGLAGGLAKSCRAGDVVVARRTSLHGTMSCVTSNEYLVQAASRCGAKPVSRMVTVDQIVGDSAQKRALASSGDAIEMESYFVLRAAVGAQVPAVAIRAISDAVGDDLPMDFSRVVDSQGAVKMRRLVAELARKPGGIPRLVRFAMRSRRAARALADFLDRYLLALDHPWKKAESIALREVAAT